MTEDIKQKSARKGLMSNFLEKCRENGLKITPQRVAIYEELTRVKEHPSADLLHRRLKKTFPNISLDTVNRTLLTFSQIGIIRVVEGYGQPKRFDSNVESHHHFRCIRCDSIVDFYDESLDDMKVPKEILRKFTVFNKKVVLEGLCDRCSQSG
jgi:Fur family peroxide stress response transcriptional regulator